MAKARIDIIDRIVYLGARLASTLLHSFPAHMTLAAAKRIGDLLYFVDAPHRNRALENLRHAYPQLAAVDIQRMARRSMQHLCMLGAEVLLTTRLIRIDTWAAYVRLGDIREALALLVRRERGLIMLTAHYGSWEILGYTLATLGFEINVVARPLDNPYIERWLLGVRERQGQKMIAKRGATAEVTDVLDRHGVVAFIADQNAGPKGLFVDFFGRKASTYKSIGLLAMEYRVPIVIGYARRLDGRFHFEAGVQEIIYPEEWDSQSDPLRYITQRYTRAIEEFVRAEPEQYLWVHRRWKSRPKGE